jgi:hypothetical protein
MTPKTVAPITSFDVASLIDHRCDGPVDAFVLACRAIRLMQDVDAEQSDEATSKLIAETLLQCMAARGLLSPKGERALFPPEGASINSAD